MNTYNMDKMYESYADTVERMQMWLDESEQENKQLKDNWNKLKEWTKKAVDKYYDCDLRVDMVYKNVLDRMQELEKGDSNEQGRI